MSLKFLILCCKTFKKDWKRKNFVALFYNNSLLINYCMAICISQQYLWMDAFSSPCSKEVNRSYIRVGRRSALKCYKMISMKVMQITKWLSGLGVWFLLWVQEVPGSNPGWALLFCLHGLPAKERPKLRGHPDLNRGPLDLQSNALPLSYTPADAF